MPIDLAKPPFTNLQLELLKLYNRSVDEKELRDIKEILGIYFLDKAVDGADKVWDERKTEIMEKIQHLLKK